MDRPVLVRRSRSLAITDYEERNAELIEPVSPEGFFQGETGLDFFLRSFRPRCPKRRKLLRLHNPRGHGSLWRSGRFDGWRNPRHVGFCRSCRNWSARLRFANGLNLLLPGRNLLVGCRRLCGIQCGRSQNCRTARALIATASVNGSTPSAELCFPFPCCGRRDLPHRRRRGRSPSRNFGLARSRRERFCNGRLVGYRGLFNDSWRFRWSYDGSRSLTSRRPSHA